ncbi:hypothetical protein [uncultured Acinetobacter sp.]|uniref:hypothetical protein n=1 Tax=uncultured Acinetobacter sp. TaxID=165433 RepID=UPI00260855E8|nr:hypothetical protein [uncultured Acinetobacter sp.]
MNSQVLESVILVAQIENLDSARQRAAQYSHSQMLYNLQLKDGANYIKAHASISIIPKCIQDGMIVEVICQYKPIISKKNDCLEIEANILKIKQLEDPEKHYIDHTALMLQNLKPNRVIFPEHETPKVTLLYSNASQALVNKDFLDALDYQKNYIILDTKTVNLSDVKSLSQTINDIKTDILIIIRGGGGI